MGWPKTRHCLTCGKDVRVPRWKALSGRGKYCSDACRIAGQVIYESDDERREHTREYNREYWHKAHRWQKRRARREKEA